MDEDILSYNMLKRVMLELLHEVVDEAVSTRPTSYANARDKGLSPWELYNAVFKLKRKYEKL